MLPRSACANSTLPPLPRLSARGERPEWDDYLSAVYGEGVVYPVELSSFRWFYRCDCHTLGDSCTRAPTACNLPSEVNYWARMQRLKIDGLQAQLAHGAARRRPAVTHNLSQWSVPEWYAHLTSRPLTASCSGAVAPLPDVVPKVWLSAQPVNATDAADPARGRAAAAPEAFVGAMFTQWPSPEFWLAPFGWWVFPMPPPRCIEGNQWIEVTRVVQPSESDWNATFYFHAPGRCARARDCLAAPTRVAPRAARRWPATHASSLHA